MYLQQLTYQTIHKNNSVQYFKILFWRKSSITDQITSQNQPIIELEKTIISTRKIQIRCINLNNIFLSLNRDKTKIYCSKCFFFFHEAQWFLFTLTNVVQVHVTY